MTKAVAPLSASQSLVNSFDINCRITNYMLKNLDPRAWDAPTLDGKGRNIAGIVAHIHSVRVMWLKAAGGAPINPIDKESNHIADALAALDESASALRELISKSAAGDGHIKGFRPDVAAFVGYLIAHDAHHRGQIAMLARQSGHPLSKSAGFGMWEWGVR